jgi:hypothetical protein
MVIGIVSEYTISKLSLQHFFRWFFKGKGGKVRQGKVFSVPGRRKPAAVVQILVRQSAGTAQGQTAPRHEKETRETLPLHFSR